MYTFTINISCRIHQYFKIISDIYLLSLQCFSFEKIYNAYYLAQIQSYKLKGTFRFING